MSIKKTRENAGKLGLEKKKYPRLAARSSPQLKPHQFKKGNRAYPKKIKRPKRLISWIEIRSALTDFANEPVVRKKDGSIIFGGKKAIRTNLDLIIARAVEDGKLTRENISFFTLLTGAELDIKPKSDQKTIDLSGYSTISPAKDDEEVKIKQKIEIEDIKGEKKDVVVEAKVKRLPQISHKPSEIDIENAPG